MANGGARRVPGLVAVFPVLDDETAQVLRHAARRTDLGLRLDGPPLALSRVMQPRTVKEMMSGVVETLSVGDTLATARRQLERGRIRHLPVVDGDERLVGLLTHRQVLEAWVSHGHPDREDPALVARDVPSR